MEEIVDDVMPAAKSSAASLEETPAHLSLKMESCAHCSAATDSAESQLMVHSLDQLQPQPQRLFWSVQPAYPASAG